MLSSRELASLIWLAVFAAAVTVMAIRDRSMLVDLWEMVWLVVRPPISTVVAVFYGYLAGWLWLASVIGLWGWGLVGETVLWGVFSGLALAFSATKASKPAYFRKALFRVFEATLILEFVYDLASFPLAVELAAQAVITVLVLMEFAVTRDPRTTEVRGCVQGLLAAAVGIYLGFTVWLSWRNRHVIDWHEQMQVFGMLVWLPLVALPFVYVLAWGMSYGDLVRMVKWHQDGRSIRWSTRVAILWGFNVYLSDLGQAKLHPARELARASGLHGQLAAIREFRRGLDRAES